MFAQAWIEALSMAFNTSTVGAGILVSIILVVTVDLFTMMVTKKPAMPMCIIDVFLILGLVWAQWLPTFTGSALAILMAILSAYIIKERI